MLILYAAQSCSTAGRLFQQPYIASVGVTPQASGALPSLAVSTAQMWLSKPSKSSNSIAQWSHGNPSLMSNFLSAGGSVAVKQY